MIRENFGLSGLSCERVACTHFTLKQYRKGAQNSMTYKNGFFGSVLVLAVILGAVAPGALATPIGYAVDGNDNTLYTIDLSTSTATLIGHTGQLFEGIALSPGGTLFGTDSSGRLWTIDKTTAVPTLVGNTGLGDLEGLDFNGATLIASNLQSPTSIYSLDTSNAVPTLLATTSGEPVFVTPAMAALSGTSALLMTYTGWPPEDWTLRSVDLTTGAVTTLGPSSSASGIFGIDFAGSTLYGLGASGKVYTINPINGATTLLGNTGGQYWLDLTIAQTAVVPEPISMIFFGTGLVGVWGYVARRRNR
jgi:hypothetical protein